ncbi:MAG TPA: SGNH/GDSL hydrolase family protein [Phycisphaerae bacterium]|nr:SGNH/GDSL hydrolase family protein [Phycisphaerae bacterium]
MHESNPVIRMMGAAFRTRRLLAVVAWTAAFLLTAEAAVRVRAWVRRGETGTQQDIYESDPQLGRVIKAGAVSRVGDAKTTINKWGLRGPDFDIEKAPGVTRVLCLGASTTFGQPDDDDAEIWTTRLSVQLNAAHNGQRFEVLNGAVPGYTVTQSLDNFRRSLARFKPDVVVVCHAATDLAAHTRRQFGGKSAISYGLPSLSRYMEGVSLAYELTKANTAFLRAGQFRRNRNRRVDQRGIERFEQSLSDLIAECQKTHAQVIVCTFARAFSADQSPSTRAKLAATACYFNPQLTVDGLIDAYERYNDAIRLAANERGARLADADQRIPKEKACFRDSIHFSPLGHERMAHLVAEQISALPTQPLTQARIDSPNAVQ